LLIRVYSGPGSSLVQDKWAPGIDWYMASKWRFVVAFIDARNSDNRGSKYREAAYKRLGTVEIEDQILFSKKLERELDYVHENRIGVWGWSYGGFATAHIVEQGGVDLFRCAASVAPVTNFKYYDAAYTERYMDLPENNVKNYEFTDVTTGNVSAFGALRYYLAHGTGDDNVHFQNAMHLAKALIQHNVQFQFMAYPDQQHDIHDNLRHLITNLGKFFDNCFKFHAIIPVEEEMAPKKG